MSTLADTHLDTSIKNEAAESGRTIVRKDIAQAVYKGSTLSRAESAAIMNAILDTVIETVASGEEVKLHGFGKFNVLNKKARVGRNPRTGVEATITARRTVSFHPSPKLIKVVNGK